MSTTRLSRNEIMEWLNEQRNVQEMRSSEEQENKMMKLQKENSELTEKLAKMEIKETVKVTSVATQTDVDEIMGKN